MTLMVLSKEQPVVPIKAAGVLLQLLAQQILLEELLPEPNRHGHTEGLKSARRKGEISFEQPLESEQRLVVKSDIVDLAKICPTFAKTILHRYVRKAGV